MAASMTTSEPGTKAKVMWVRTEPDDDLGPLDFHALVGLEADGRARVLCGWIIPGPFGSREKDAGHWPTRPTCRACIAITAAGR